MKYRREIDGLRALAVMPVILFHAGFQFFSGGYIGVDVFFVISGYLITTILLSELEEGRFSIVNFYARRARRILPALIFVLTCSLPFAWLWLFPQDMNSFAQSLTAVTAFVSNIFFWKTSGYFDTAAELKPLLHTWSLAVEEQYYLFFPILLMATWQLGKLRVAGLLALIFLASFGAALWAVHAKPMAAFFLLPTRGWELLVGGFAAFYLHGRAEPPLRRWLAEAGGMAGVILIVGAVFLFDKNTPFPGLPALVPTLGAALIIVCSHPGTLAGKLLGFPVLVGIGLISYSAYLWHQPIFAFARHRSLDEPGHLVFGGLTVLTLLLAVFSWRFVERPFRKPGQFTRRQVFVLGLACSLILAGTGWLGSRTDGFSSRYDIALAPKPWDSIKCHGAAAIAAYEDPLAACLGAAGNGKGGDIYLIGDSHAAQLTFPLGDLARSRGSGFFFINTEGEGDFPYSFLKAAPVEADRLLDHVAATADQGDLLVMTFHRGRLNDSRDRHLPLSEDPAIDARTETFIQNMERYLPKLAKAGLKIYLVKDTPLLSETTNVEKCAYFNLKTDTNPCLVGMAQDTHTRLRQSRAFDRLAADYPGSVIVLDPLPALYAGKETFNPIYPDGSYRMFDKHHLTAPAALELLPYFRQVVR